MTDGNLQDEKTLIQQAIRGEASAFGLLYDRYQTKIYRFIYLKVSHREEAEDLTHQVFLSAWKNINGYVYQGLPFSSWLYKMSRNAVIDHYRTKKYNVCIDEISEDIPQLIMESDFEKTGEKMNLKIVYSCLKKLPFNYKEVLTMRFVDGMEIGEISKLIGKSSGAVKVIQHRAMQKLKDFIKENENERR